MANTITSILLLSIRLAHDITLESPSVEDAPDPPDPPSEGVEGGRMISGWKISLIFTTQTWQVCFDSKFIGML